MKKFLLALFLAFVLLAAPIANANDEVEKTGLDLCPLCVQFGDQALNNLINIILNVGVIGTCGKLCSKLEPYGKYLPAACDLLCDYVGVDEFIKIIQKADLDPIYYCQLLHACPVHDCQGNCANVTAVNVSPKKGTQGDTFDIEALFSVYKETGTGELALQVIPPGGFPLGDNKLVPKGYEPGNYKVSFDLKAKPSENEPFMPGTYKVVVGLCEGQCGSDHPHSKVLAEGQGEFQIEP
eukprot:gb/GECH01011116.1/.p1 GENE.gb/GECH01011116.1/~~gb/GECH01011116.1/.p1  ORF type:complete len:238 (+),score=57.24 gb/GECH01011116.1/:1-714(+)